MRATLKLVAFEYSRLLSPERWASPNQLQALIEQRLTFPAERGFCQLTTFGPQLHLCPGSPACWPMPLEGKQDSNSRLAGF